MDDRKNTIAGWILAGGIAALGLSILSSKYFHADKPERPEEMGYAIEGVETAGGEESGPPFAALLAEADLAKGESQFAKCGACHTITQGGANGIGPNLYGVMGKKHGHIPGFAYSDAISSISGNWDWEEMNQWIESPRKYAPGTKMTFAGIGNDQDRANLIAYVNNQGSNLPLPPVPVAEAPAEGEGAEGDAAAPAEGKEATAGEEAPADATAEGDTAA